MKNKSLVSSFLEKLARDLNIKRGFTESGMPEHLKKAEKYNKEKYKLPIMLIKSTITSYVVEGMQCFKITPKHCHSHKHILYFHGGAYIDNPLVFHWLFLDKVATKLGVSITVPIYPKLPYSNVNECYEKSIMLYKLITANYGEGNIILMGDSAGAGLCVGLTERFIDENIIKPRKLVLISPWVDVSMEREISKESEAKDIMLSSFGLKYLGNMWAGELGVKHKLVSPVYGNLKLFPETLIVAGENEIILKDIIDFSEKLKNNGCKVTLAVKEEQGHVYPLYPLKEAKSGVKKICDYIARR